MRGEGLRARRGPTGFAVVIAALVVVSGLAACSTTSFVGSRPVTPIAVNAGQAARVITAYRAEHGLGAVKVDPRLMRVASDYAHTMGARDKIAHSIGGSLPKRVSAAGYDWGAVAENLAAGYPSLDDAMAGWKASAGHRHNLLTPYAADIGIAAVAMPPGSDHRNYWVLILAMPQPERMMARFGGRGPFR